ncbi:hypothetical protein TSAR_002287 [Trichomalopsis sarcophagae]|uniref:Uncharacterized protein n=1 Tax=Trichomalopsis sarcophagae TaxID=543379 RepID=A0A232FHI0_9HYME|nr:hypothetical protein TSAR_002287 [Trichomalopsis sarcophagae]
MYHPGPSAATPASLKEAFERLAREAGYKIVPKETREASRSREKKHEKTRKIRITSGDCVEFTLKIRI